MSTSLCLQCSDGSLPYLTPTLLSSCFNKYSLSSSPSPSALSFTVNFCDAAVGSLQYHDVPPHPSKVKSKSNKKESPPPSSPSPPPPASKRKRSHPAFIGNSLTSYYRIDQSRFSTLVVPGYSTQLDVNCKASNAKKFLREKSQSKVQSDSSNISLGLQIDTRKGRTLLTPSAYNTQVKLMEASLGHSTMYVLPKPQQKVSVSGEYQSADEKISCALLEQTRGDKVWRSLSTSEIDTFTSTYPTTPAYAGVVVVGPQPPNPTPHNISQIEKLVLHTANLVVLNNNTPEQVLLLHSLKVPIIGTQFPQQFAKLGKVVNVVQAEVAGKVQRIVEHVDLNLSKHKLSTSPISDTCGCVCCARHSRGYLHHLLNVKEVTSEILLFIHNTTQILEILSAVRRVEDKGLGQVSE
ncbi:hypothetical protein ScalyP_jg1045 [Parmales sp. scaly parma]|nr:hypothetical protein ScalyP_jg1045 [Parmales sp. scaly parma]